MQSQPLEPELESFLTRMDPGADARWRGADPETIERIEQLAGRPLPPCYRWFLARMGADMGPIKYASIDFSAATVLDCHARGLVPHDPRYLLIGWCTDEVVPMHYFIDLDRPAADDARVVRRYATGVDEHSQFAGLRDMLAWGEFSRRRVRRQAQQCYGSLRAPDGDVVAQLAPPMERLGFTRPFVTSPWCGLFERDDAAMLASTGPEDEPPEFFFFRIGASETPVLRRLLGTLSAETPLTVKVRAWEPPLPRTLP